jgi:hypothetical protein
LQSGPGGAQVGEPVRVPLDPLPARRLRQRTGLERGQLTVDRRFGLGDLGIQRLKACNELGLPGVGGCVRGAHRFFNEVVPLVGGDQRRTHCCLQGARGEPVGRETGVP